MFLPGESQGPVFLPRESQGQGSLVGCHLWGHTELDMNEVTLRQWQQLFDIDSLLYSKNGATGFMVSKGEDLTLGPKTVTVTRRFV